MGKRGELLPINHGTDPANAQRCRRRNPGGICDLCRPVFAAYHRERRRNDAQAREAYRMQNRARQRALVRLAHAHPVEFRDLLFEEMQRERRQDERGAA